MSDLPGAPTIRSESPDQPEVRALLAALDGYLASLYPPEANHIVDEAALLQPDVAFFVARAGNGRAVGTAAFVRHAGFGEVKRMFVDPAVRGGGLGERLLAVLEEAMRSQGLAQARLETGAAQHAAVKLYERCGYRRCAAFGGYPDNGLSVFYAKALPT